MQVKNYYLRQIESGKMSEWEELAREADEERARGESTGPLPSPTIMPKRRFDEPPGLFPRSESVMEGVEDLNNN
jgi:hypothetical protein